MTPRELFWTCVGVALLILAAVLAFQPRAMADNEVDAAIVLLADMSNSMKDDEREIVIKGHVRALQSPEFIDAIQRGQRKRIAVAYVEFASYSHTVVNWSLIDGPESASEFARQIRENERPSIGTMTGVGIAMAHAADLLQSLPVFAETLVVDLVGDGKSGTGVHPAVPRKRLLDMGARVNVLAVMKRPDAPNLTDYFFSEIAGGPGHFVLSVDDVSQIPMMLRRKLVLELF